MSLAEKLSRGLRRRQLERRMPFEVTLTDFDADGVTFEITNRVEYHRVVEHGDETEYTRAMLDALRPDDVFYDVGANVGLVALHAASRCEHTIAFEPDVEFRARLQRNAALNPSRSILIREIAIADEDGIETLYTDGAAGNSPSLVRQRGEKGELHVTARSLDSLCASGELPRPTVVKVDIEGAEILALRGGQGLFTSAQRPRALFIEVHDSFLPGFGSSANEVMRLLADYGYEHEAYRAPRADQHHLILECT